MTMVNRTSKPSSVRVGFFSRVDYLDKGYRKDLLRVAFEVFQHLGVAFNVLHGGLVSGRKFSNRFRENVAAELQVQSELPRDQRKPRKEIVEETDRQTQEDIAEELCEAFPKVSREDGEMLRTFIMTAPAVNYDGRFGSGVAHRLASFHPAVRFWGSTDKRFRVPDIKGADGRPKNFRVVLPTKAAWRSKYYSTRPDRLVEDVEKQSSQSPPDFWVSDNPAATIFRPGGKRFELSRSRISFPGLHRLQEVTTSENQVGVGVVEISADREVPTVWVASLKDLVSDERLFILNPVDASELQKAILRELKAYPQTIGMLEDAIGKSRQSIEDAIRKYNAKGFEPPIVFSGESHEYDISNRWMQQNLSYALPDFGMLTEDRVASFCCLHAGYRTTQARWFTHDFPQAILSQGSKILVSCGDLIGGLEHYLDRRGEIIGGWNYTDHEYVAAHLVGEVLFKPFCVRLDEILKRSDKALDGTCLVSAIDEALIWLFYWLGNHDKWLLKHGVTPYATFTAILRWYLIRNIDEFLRAKGLPCSRTTDIVAKHLVYGDEHTLPSGLQLAINHPEMARAQTASLRPQQVLAARPEAHICVYGNFHTAKMVGEWNHELGQRIAFENGCILSGTDFEEGKLKRVDTCVGFLATYSHNGRIFMTKTDFESPREDQIEYCHEDMSPAEYLKRIGIHPVEML